MAEKGALEVRLSTSDSGLQDHQQQLSELTQKHTAIQAELADSLEYQQQIEAQLNELEMETQAAKASYEAEQAQCQKLAAEVSQAQTDLARVENELSHTKTALDQTSDLSRELQVIYTCLSRGTIQLLSLAAAAEVMTCVQNICQIAWAGPT